MENKKTLKFVTAGLLAALAFIAFYFLKFQLSLPLGNGNVFIHLANAVCVLAALLLGGVYGGLAGAVGLTLADILSGYAIYAPETFFLKLCIGIVTGIIAHKIGKLSQQKTPKKVFLWTLIASASGLAFNVIFDPLMNYFYTWLLAGKPAALVNLPMEIGVTAFNAAISLVAVVPIYLLLRPALMKAGLFFIIGEQKDETR